MTECGANNPADPTSTIDRIGIAGLNTKNLRARFVVRKLLRAAEPASEDKRPLSACGRGCFQTTRQRHCLRETEVIRCKNAANRLSSPRGLARPPRDS